MIYHVPTPSLPPCRRRLNILILPPLIAFFHPQPKSHISKIPATTANIIPIYFHIVFFSLLYLLYLKDHHLPKGNQFHLLQYYYHVGLL